MTSRSLGVAMLGYGFMGRAHSYAYHATRVVTQPSPVTPRLISISGRDQSQAEIARERYGWEVAEQDWAAQVTDDRVALLDNVGPNDLHYRPTLAALENGKHVLCEKPLAPTADEAFALWAAAERAAAVHMCGFNYRFFPAIQRARQLIDAGAIGDVEHFRSWFLVSRAQPADPRPDWRTERSSAAGGVLRDLGSHHIDLARLLVGEPRHVRASLSRHEDGPEHGFQALVEFEGGATGTLEASSLTSGYLCRSEIEVSGTRGWLRFSLARLNELEISQDDDRRTDHVTAPNDPFMGWWYPPGHGLGWGDSFTHQIDHLLRAIAGERQVAPIGATFEDGYRCAEICDAIERAASTGDATDIDYRSPPGPRPHQLQSSDRV